MSLFFSELYLRVQQQWELFIAVFQDKDYPKSKGARKYLKRRIERRLLVTKSRYRR